MIQVTQAHCNLAPPACCWPWAAYQPLGVPTLSAPGGSAAPQVSTVISSCQSCLSARALPGFAVFWELFLILAVYFQQLEAVCQLQICDFELLVDKLSTLCIPVLVKALISASETAIWGKGGELKVFIPSLPASLHSPSCRKCSAQAGKGLDRNEEELSWRCRQQIQALSAFPRVFPTASQGQRWIR